jgi:hypothetical protein
VWKLVAALLSLALLLCYLGAIPKNGQTRF